MSSPAGPRQRGAAKDSKKRASTPLPDDGSSVLPNGTTIQQEVDQLKKAGKEVVTRDWDYKLALTVITVLAFVTRFWGIRHPNQVVFDEVHFGKVRSSSL